MVLCFCFPWTCCVLWFCAKGLSRVSGVRFGNEGKDIRRCTGRGERLLGVKRGTPLWTTSYRGTPDPKRHVVTDVLPQYAGAFFRRINWFFASVGCQSVKASRPRVYTYSVVTSLMFVVAGNKPT